MAETTQISWFDHTFNPWIGCMKVSPACDGCYAENLMETRMGRAVWGTPGKGAGTRVRTEAPNWRKPLAWNRKAARDGTRPFVFCASLADVFDNAVDPAWRRDLFELIRTTPYLTWLLLTKRPSNIIHLFAETLPAAADKRDDALRAAWPRNAAIGCTIVTQEEADRDVRRLLRAKAALKPAFAYVSMEPQLARVELNGLRLGDGHYLDALRGEESDGRVNRPVPALDWVITGGETDQGAHKARPSDPDWFRSIRDQCAAAGVPYHHKQNGEWIHRPELISASGPDVLQLPDGRWLEKVGKKRAGRLLDGVMHDAFPAVSDDPAA